MKIKIGDEVKFIDFFNENKEVNKYTWRVINTNVYKFYLLQNELGMKELSTFNSIKKVENKDEKANIN